MNSPSQPSATDSDILSAARESLSSGVAKPEAIPRYHQRAFSHNYHAPFIYHIILKKTTTAETFGIVKGNPLIAPGQLGCAYIEESSLGKTIARSIIGIQYQFPILQIYQFIVMPDHVHILLRVKDWSEKHLDFYIETLTANIATTHSKTTGHQISPTDIFQPGYCDKPLLIKRSLDTLFRYIRENPHRLAIRRQFPQFFQRKRRIRIGAEEYEAYGNLFLFRNPDKEAVKISRSFSPEEKAGKKAAWLHNAAKGTVLVSPFISKEEKAIRTEAEALGGKIILITHEAFSERFKPADHDFALCASGRLLIISLGLAASTALSRAHCMQMNALSEAIAACRQCGSHE